MKKILVVEDNEQNRFLMQFMLEQTGYEVITADSGSQAIVMAVRDRPDLILMDIQLPDMDGLEVTRRIRNLEFGLKNGEEPKIQCQKSKEKRLPIVAVTSFAMAGDREKALAAGCNGYIEKPINPETFLDEIAKFI